MSKKHLAMTVGALLGFIATTLGYWLAGYDFNERGNWALGWYLVSLLVAFFAAGFAAIDVADDE